MVDDCCNIPWCTRTKWLCGPSKHLPCTSASLASGMIHAAFYFIIFLTLHIGCVVAAIYLAIAGLQTIDHHDSTGYSLVTGGGTLLFVSTKMLIPVYTRIFRCIGEIRWLMMKLKKDISGGIHEAINASEDNTEAMLIKKDKDYLIELHKCLSHMYQDRGE